MGLGGTSLINANVSLKADKRVFKDKVWPCEIRREHANGQLKKYYKRAKAMLKPNPYPLDNSYYPEPKKTKAHKQSASFLKKPFKLTPINVNFNKFNDGRNHVGVNQQPCTGCGDCVSGCNYGSKNTVLMNYLPDAVNHCADIFTQTSVQWIQRQKKKGRKKGQWMVFFHPIEMGREEFDSPPLFVTADVVIVSAGSLGSTEILLRSQHKGLSLSKRLGHGFTGNGDVLAFSYNCDKIIHGIGDGADDPNPADPVGPCITSVIDARNKAKLNDGMVIQEGSMPGMLKQMLPVMLAAVDAVIGKDQDRGVLDWIQEKCRILRSLFCGSNKGAVEHTQTLLVMTHDDAKGQMKLKNDRLRIRWPGVGSQSIFKKVRSNLQKATKALGGTFIRNPLEVLQKDLITVHPMGGCPMSKDAEGGVVNHKCQVFSGTTGKDVHDGLYVADGAVIPRSIGVNPLLTISALAERTCEKLICDRGWGSIDYSLDKPSSPPGSCRMTGFRFTEKMEGNVSPPEESDAMGDDLNYYHKAADSEKKTGFHSVLTIEGLELDQFLTGPEHKAHIMGIVEAPILSSKPLTARGHFNLSTIDSGCEGTKKMRYAMKLSSEEGESFFFEGFKVCTDLLTLYITIYKGHSSAGCVLQRGILKIAKDDFANQMKTMQILDANPNIDKAKATEQLAKLFEECA